MTRSTLLAAVGSRLGTASEPRSRSPTRRLPSGSPEIISATVGYLLVTQKYVFGKFDPFEELRARVLGRCAPPGTLFRGKAGAAGPVGSASKGVGASALDFCPDEFREIFAELGGFFIIHSGGSGLVGKARSGTLRPG